MKIAIYKPTEIAFSFNVLIKNIYSELLKNNFQVFFFDNILNIPENVDLIWEPTVGGGYLPRLNKQFTKKPIVITIHGTGIFSISAFEQVKNYNFFKAQIEFLRILRRRIYLRKQWNKYANDYAVIITVSNYAKSEITRHLGIKTDKIKVIYHGINQQIFNTKSLTTKEEKYFLHISEYQPKKNIFRIINAYKKAFKENKNIPKLKIICPKFPKKVNHPSIIIKTEYIEQQKVANYMRNAIAFIFPSLHETFGFPIAEAMACGTPVITSNTTSCPEIAGNSALIINPYKINEIKNAILKIHNKANLTKQLINKGLTKSAKYNWQQSGQEHINTFNQIISTSNK